MVQEHYWPLRGELLFGKRPMNRMVRGQSDRSEEAARQESLQKLLTELTLRESKLLVDRHPAVQKQLGVPVEHSLRST